MALDPKGGGPKNKRHWAWMRIGYTSKSTQGGRFGGGKAHTIKGKPVYKWVRVGTPFYNQLRSKGIAPAMVKAGRQPRRSPGGSYIGKGGNSLDIGHTVKPGNTKGASLDGVRVHGDGPKIGTKAGDKAMNKLGKNGGGGGGNGPNRKRKKQRSSGFQSATSAIGKQLGGTKAGQKLGGGYAEAQAGLQFDAPIKDLKTLIARLGPQNTQAINDLTNWYGSVSQLNQQAGQRAGDIASDVSGAQDQTIQGLMAALGGGSNAGNAQLAALQANDSAYQKVLGGIEQQYHSDMDPIISQAGAQAKEREQRLNLTQMQDYQLQLADLMGQRGQAKAASQMQVDQYNNELAQQWFQNRLAKLNAALGAQAAGVDMQVKQAQLKQAKRETKASKGGPVAWKSLNPAERDELLQRATGSYVGTDGLVHAQRSKKQAQALLSSWLKSPVGSGKNPGLLTALYQYYN